MQGLQAVRERQETSSVCDRIMQQELFLLSVVRKKVQKGCCLRERMGDTKADRYIV